MRESRTSGSVEGAMGNHSSYSDPIKGEEALNLTTSENSGCACGQAATDVALSEAIPEVKKCRIRANSWMGQHCGF